MQIQALREGLRGRGFELGAVVVTGVGFITVRATGSGSTTRPRFFPPPTLTPERALQRILHM
jgi:hypothetical protein